MPLILRYLSPKDIANLKKVDRKINSFITVYEKYAYSPNKLLKRYFNDPLQFRAMQAATGTLVSGSQALKLMGRFGWEPGDLDLYVWRTQTWQVCEWLVCNGYTFQCRTSNLQDDTYMENEMDTAVDVESTLDRAITASPSHIADIYFFESQLPNNSEVRRIQVIVPKQSPISTILKFHSSKKS
ncbi:MAG TPA: hypothetical protein VGO47_04595 [Chlamydiales bacterium]|nr:hypothetical protein [Chlamydiales bacterium]